MNKDEIMSKIGIIKSNISSNQYDINKYTNLKAENERYLSDLE